MIDGILNKKYFIEKRATLNIELCLIIDLKICINLAMLSATFKDISLSKI